MEPITHFLTGACLGRSGFNRKTAYATLAMTLAAEAPDLDVLWGLRGPVAGFQHHRGITHTFLGAPFVALAVTGLVWLFHRSKRTRPSMPVRWFLVWVFSLIAVLSHIFLDWTNNYGIRPFFPFNPRWYSLDIVFIFEPVIFAVLLLGLVIPAILGMADREMGAGRAALPARAWAISALCLAGLVTGARWAEHHRGLQLVNNNLFHNEPVVRCRLEPYPINPFRWFAVVETANFFQTGSVDTRKDDVEIDNDLIFKPPVTAAVTAAKGSWLGRVYLDWAKFPVITDLGSAGLIASGPSVPNPMDTAVEFRDLRFSYSPLAWASASGGSVEGVRAPLGGWVYVGPGGAIDGMAMGNRLQK